MEIRAIMDCYVIHKVPACGFVAPYIFSSTSMSFASAFPFCVVCVGMGVERVYAVFYAEAPYGW